VQLPLLYLLHNQADSSRKRGLINSGKCLGSTRLMIVFCISEVHRGILFVADNNCPVGKAGRNGQ